ncbi:MULTISPECIES: hypothetical protein [Arenibacter]|nr:MULTISPECIES: hypothetical protein [Arenibacter]
MNSAALIIMLLVQGVIISFVAYFFYRVLNMPPKPEPDSNSDNDEVLIG